MTNQRVVCRRLARLDDSGWQEGWYYPRVNGTNWHDPGERQRDGRLGYTHPAGVLADGVSFKPSKVRLQDRKTVLLEGKPFDQLFMQVELGFFEPTARVPHVLVVTVQVAAKG